MFRELQIMRVSSADFIKRYGALTDRAITEPVTITRNGRDRLVLISAEEFERLRSYAPRVRYAHELTDDELALIADARVPAQYEPLDSLLDD